jgi:spermidine synthase
LGYFVGGILADRFDRLRLLAILLGFACLCTILIPFVARAYLASSLAADQSIMFGTILGTSVIFFLPAFFLATIPPLCVKAISENIKLIGLSSGIVSSSASIGSILGTFSTGFFLVPHFKLSTIYLLSAAILLGLLLIIVLMIWHSKRKSAMLYLWLLVIPSGVGLMYSVGTKPDIFPSQGEIERVLTPYHLITVFSDHGMYRLKLDSTDEGAISHSGQSLPFPYTRYWQLSKAFLESEQLRRVCFVGGGAFAMPNIMHRALPDIYIDTIEIDPALVPIAKKYFHLRESDKFKVHVEDGRRWFFGKRDLYDMIFLDAFRGVKNIPSHLVTKEYFQQLHTALTEHGILAINVIAPVTGQGSVLYYSLVKTLLHKFPQVYVFTANSADPNQTDNLILYALKSPPPNSEQQSKQRAKQHNIMHLYDQMITIFRQSDLNGDKLKHVTEFTDQYAPVEYIVAQE